MINQRLVRRYSKLLSYIVEETTECPPWGCFGIEKGGEKIEQPYPCGEKGCKHCWEFFVDLDRLKITKRSYPEGKIPACGVGAKDVWENETRGIQITE